MQKIEEIDKNEVDISTSQAIEKLLLLKKAVRFDDLTQTKNELNQIEHIAIDDSSKTKPKNQGLFKKKSSRYRDKKNDSNLFKSNKYFICFKPSISKNADPKINKNTVEDAPFLDTEAKQYSFSSSKISPNSNGIRSHFWRILSNFNLKNQCCCRYLPSVIIISYT
jgi:hypothetical protein